jgi:tRNA pseudouridine55 synthase
VLLLDKPRAGPSTQASAAPSAARAAEGRAHRHPGSLRTGCCRSCFGEATKFSRFLIDAPKEYLATLRLGQTSTTGMIPKGVISAPDR